MTQQALEVQGHRGARGLKPENTLVGFEVALDLGVSAIETDLHLSRDEVPVLYHDPQISPRLCSLRPGHVAPAPTELPRVRQLTLDQLRCYRVDQNPAPTLFPAQDTEITPLASAVAVQAGLDPLGIPTLADFFAFVAAYAGSPGQAVGKTPVQQTRAARLLFDLELKHMPFWPEAPGLLERRVLDLIEQHGMRDRTVIRSFDHRSVRLIIQMESRLRTAVLVAHTAPVDPVALVRATGADIYGPDFRFVDEAMIRQIRQAGHRVIPWTVNEAADWERLITWGVAGLTTDFPDRLLAWLSERGIPVA